MSSSSSLSLSLDELVEYVLLCVNSNDTQYVQESNEPENNILNKIKVLFDSVTEISITNNSQDSLYLSVLYCVKNDLFLMSEQNKNIFLLRFIEKFKKDAHSNKTMDKKNLFKHILCGDNSDTIICFLSEFFYINIFVINLNKNETVIYYNNEFYDKYRLCVILVQNNDQFTVIQNDNLTLHDFNSSLIQYLLKNHSCVINNEVESELKFGTENLNKYLQSNTSIEQNITKPIDEQNITTNPKIPNTSTKPKIPDEQNTTIKSKISDEHESEKMSMTDKNDESEIINRDIFLKQKTENDKKKNVKNVDPSHRAVQQKSISPKGQNPIITKSDETKANISIRTKLSDLQKYANENGIPLTIEQNGIFKLKKKEQLIEDLNKKMKK